MYSNRNSEQYRPPRDLDMGDVYADAARMEEGPDDGPGPGDPRELCETHGLQEVTNVQSYSDGRAWIVTLACGCGEYSENESADVAAAR